MNIILNASSVCLAKNQSLTLDHAMGSRILCEHGGVWITQDHDLRDIVLGAGQSFTLDRDGRVIVSALELSSVGVMPATAQRGGAARLAI